MPTIKIAPVNITILVFKRQLFFQFFITIFSVSNLCAQENFLIYKNKKDSQSIYIFCRGTTSKSALISHNFNIADTNITHIGIGFYERNQFKIFNVVDKSNNTESALIIDSLESFTNSKDIYYFSIWKCKKNNIDELNKMKNILVNYSKRKICFDASFIIKNDDNLYCSEFCQKILNSVNSNKFKFKSKSVTLKNNLYKLILERTDLVYFPVDFFEEGHFFKKIYEYRFKK